MSAAVENLMVRSPARYGAAPAVSDAVWSYEREQHVRSLNASDISEVAYDESLLTAVKRGDAELVGRVLLAAVNAYLDRLADRAVDAEPRERTSEDAAAEALAGPWSIHKHMVEALHESLEFVEDQVDVVDGPDGEQLPNKAMNLATVLRDAIARALGEAA